MADSSFPFIPWTIPQRTHLNLQLALGIRPAAWRLAWEAALYLYFKRNFLFLPQISAFQKNQVKPKELNPSPSPAGGLELIWGNNLPSLSCLDSY